MARRNRQTISSFLVSVLGMLCMLKAFVWVLETKVLHTPIEIPFLNYGIIIAIVLLLLRVSFVLIKNRTRKSNDDVKEVGNDFTVPTDSVLKVLTSGLEFKGMTTHNGNKAAKFEVTAGGYTFTVKNGTVTVNAQDGFVA